VRRNIKALPPGLPGLSVDYRDSQAMTHLLEHPCDIAVMTPTPTTYDAQGYRQGFLEPVQNWLALHASSPQQQLLFVSSTRVYGDCQGGWVDETTPVAPIDAQGEIMAQAEQLLLESRHAVSVVRFSGIYGRQPARLLERLRRGEICAREPVRYGNRIHRQDCVGFLLHLISLEQRLPIYLGSDNAPVPQREVEEWLLLQLGVEISRELPPVTGPSRRCDNRALLASGYPLVFPDYQAGYTDMMTSISTPTPLGSAAT